MAGDQVVDRLSAAAIRHLLQLDAGKLREPLRHHVLRRADAAARAVADAGLRFRQRDQLGQGFGAERGCAASTIGWRDSCTTGARSFSAS